MTATLHQYLKESTRRRHESAETHPFQGALAQGRLPVPSYCLYLQQLAHLHQKFEQRLNDAWHNNAHLEQVLRTDYFQLQYLMDDLTALQAHQSEPVQQCVTAFCELVVFERNPASLLGVLYVLLGSKHGGKFIARNIKEAYNLTDGGWTYFDPFGERFKLIWQEFTAGLNSLPADQQLFEDTLAAADATFEVFIAIGDYIWRRQAEGVASSAL